MNVINYTLQDTCNHDITLSDAFATSEDYVGMLRVNAFLTAATLLSALIKRTQLYHPSFLSR